MTTITSANAVPFTNASDVVPEGLTAEGVMAYCASRLNSLDALIQSRFAEQQHRNSSLKEAGALLAKLSTWDHITRGKDGDKEILTNENQAVHRQFASELAALYNGSDDPQVKAKAAEAFAMVTGRPLALDGYGKAAPQELDKSLVALKLEGIQEVETAKWSGFIGGVKSIQDNLTKDSELSMIQLQSVVSQRQLAVQMTTQLMQTMHESCKLVIGNVRS